MLRSASPYLFGLMLVSMLHRSSAQARNLQLQVQLLVDEVWGNPTLDLPPGNQRPDLYAVLGLDSDEQRTPTVTVPRINSSIFPDDWSLSIVRDPDFLRQDHTVNADIRIFDADATADEKVLLVAMTFDPVACAVDIGDQTFSGQWRNERSLCIVQIPQLASEHGYAAIRIIGAWRNSGG
jgi:hypothetical protein